MHTKNYVWRSYSGGYSSVGGTPTITLVANNMLTPISAVSQLMIKLSFVFGVMFLLIAWIRYLRFRRNSLETRLSEVLMMLVLGIICIVIPLIVSYSTGYKILEQFSLF